MVRSTLIEALLTFIGADLKEANYRLFVRQGRKFQILGKYRGIDTVQLTRRVIEAREKESPDAIVIDGDGIGGGVVDQLRDRGFSSGLDEFHGAFASARREYVLQFAGRVLGPDARLATRRRRNSLRSRNRN